MLQRALEEMGLVAESRGQFGLIKALEKRAKKAIQNGEKEHKVVLEMIRAYKAHQVLVD